ncbi:MAG: hypothetical protein J6I97_05480 [Agathobacter sp.]|nr:hypothetical protein [Agathobacter sp.]
MTRDVTRIYWMTNKAWYTIVDGKFQLTPEAPPAAHKSFAEWHKPRKMTLKRLLLILRSKLL